MYLAIGKADQYYTLWSVTNETPRDHFFETYYNYKQNLSKDLDKAIAKAIAMGVKDDALEPDEDLRGRRGSFVKRERVKFDTDKFQFGKYMNTLFIECADVDYMLWYRGQDILVKERKLVEARIAELSDFHSIVDGKLVSNKELHSIQVFEKLNRGEEITGFCNRNLRHIGDDGKNDRYTIEVSVNGVFFSFELAVSVGVKEMMYQQFEYYVPLKEDGKILRIKNKEVTITGKDGEVTSITVKK